jgi:BON domain
VDPETDEPKHYVVAHVREALAHDSRVNELEIEITVVGGRIFLSGDVTTNERKAAIAEVVHECVPRYEIFNEVSVTQLADTDPELLR